VDSNGGSCKVVVVDEVVVDVDVVVGDVVVPGIVVSVVVVEVDVDVDVVVAKVVAVGSPVILTTGGCTVTATIDRTSWIRSFAPPDSCATQVVTGAAPHKAGCVTHFETGSRSLLLERGREVTKLR
jgi:hypothetical protein